MSVYATNRRAVYEYEILERFEAGIQLLGGEVKAVRASNLSLQGAFVTMRGSEAFLTNALISPWQPQNSKAEYDARRSRKLLLNKHEVQELIGATQQKGLTIIPLRVYTKGPRIKVEIGLARGKRQYNKKERQKERDIKRDTDRLLRGKDV
jgi:SsrA-binding protein